MPFQSGLLSPVVPSTLCPPGRLYDSTNSFYSSIMLLFAFVIASVLLAFVIRRPGEHKVTAGHRFNHHKHHRMQMA